MSKRTNIYGLYDSRGLVDGEVENIRYVGKADKPLARLREHVRDSNRGSKLPVHDWIRKLQKEGITPEMMILSMPSIDTHQGVEQHVIDILHDEGHSLLNISEGGDGFTSEQMKRRFEDPVARTRHSAVTKLTWADPVVRSRRLAAMKLAWSDPAARIRRSAATKCRYEDPAARARLSTATKLAWANPAARTRRLVALKRYWDILRVEQLRKKVQRSMLRRYL